MSAQVRSCYRGTWLVPAVVCLSFMMGCRDAKSPPEAKTPETKTPETVEPTVMQDGLPGTPEAALRQMVEGLRANRPMVIWQAMPEEFRREVNALLREFAQKMDPTLWQQSFATWEKLARLLDAKKAEILSHPQLADLSPEQKQRLDKHWDGLVELLTILIHSEVADLAQLESFEMGRFLEKTGGRWLTELAELSESLGQSSVSGMLSGLEPKTLSLEEDKAIIGWMVEGSTEPVSRFSMIRIEGRWIPAGWVPAWERIRAWRAKLRQIPAESFRQQSREKIQTLSDAERALDKLLAIETAEEFHQTLTKELGEPMVKELAALIRTLGGAGVSVPEAPPTVSETAPGSNAGSVTLIVSGATQPEDEDRIFEALLAALPGDVDVQFERTDQGLKVTVGPVADMQALAKTLSFGTITKTDVKQRTIHLDMKT